VNTPPPYQPQSTYNTPYPPAQPTLGYATPGAAMPSYELYWDGASLVTPRQVVLPDTCIKCGQPASVRKVQKVSWMHPAWSLLILVNLIILLIVYFVVRKTGSISYCLCAEHAAQRKKKFAVTWVLAAAGFATIFGGIVATGSRSRATQDLVPFLVLGGIGLLLVALIWGMTAARTIWVTKVDNYRMWVKGVNPGPG
jgi:hypothetical protein